MCSKVVKYMAWFEGKQSKKHNSVCPRALSSRPLGDRDVGLGCVERALWGTSDPVVVLAQLLVCSCINQSIQELRQTYEEGRQCHFNLKTGQQRDLRKGRWGKAAGGGGLGPRRTPPQLCQPRRRPRSPRRKCSCCPRARSHRAGRGLAFHHELLCSL